MLHDGIQLTFLFGPCALVLDTIGSSAPRGPRQSSKTFLNADLASQSRSDHPKVGNCDARYSACMKYIHPVMRGLSTAPSLSVSCILTYLTLLVDPFNSQEIMSFALISILRFLSLHSARPSKHGRSAFSRLLFTVSDCSSFISPRSAVQEGKRVDVIVTRTSHTEGKFRRRVWIFPCCCGAMMSIHQGCTRNITSPSPSTISTTTPNTSRTRTALSHCDTGSMLPTTKMAGL